MNNKGNRKMNGGWTPGKEGSGPDGQCICIKCNYIAPKKRAVPCMEEKCPKCGSVLLRKGGSHHLKAVKNKL